MKRHVLSLVAVEILLPYRRIFFFCKLEASALGEETHCMSKDGVSKEVGHWGEVGGGSCSHECQKKEGIGGKWKKGKGEKELARKEGVDEL